jgi:hypothetical protein
MDVNAGHWENTKAKIRVSFESDSNVNEEREGHSAKQKHSRTATDDGIQMDFNAPHVRNVELPITVSFEFGSNVTNDREEDLLKHRRSKTSTDEGI